MKLLIFILLPLLLISGCGKKQEEPTAAKTAEVVKKTENPEEHQSDVEGRIEETKIPEEELTAQQDQVLEDHSAQGAKSENESNPLPVPVEKPSRDMDGTRSSPAQP